MILARVVDEAAERFRDRIAYVTAAGEPLTYADLREQTLRAAHWLRGQGVGPGDVVALALPADVEYVSLYVGAARLGAITAGINTRLTNDERSKLIELVGPALLVDESVAPALGRESTRALDEPDVDDESPVAIVFTSGTTGIPKAAVFASRQLSAIAAIDTGGRWDGGGAQLAGNSFASLGPMTKLPGNLMRGGTTYLVERWNARLALETTERHQLSSVAGIPTQVALMLRDPEFASFDLTSVRAIVVGGGPATPTLIREARQRFSAPLAVRYSCTEAGIGLGTAFDAPDEDAEVSVGRPHPGVELSILGDDGQATTLGEVGEVCLRSPAVMSGYWRDTAATEDVFTTSGAIRTGDLGWIDEQGRLRLSGRRKEMYVRGGYNVYPIEVEAALAAHDDIAEVAVVPRPDDVMGEIGVAFVVGRPGRPIPTLEQLRTFGTQQLAPHKLPERLVAVDALPLTSAEKVDRRALIALLPE